jgi:hypothetical protein
MRMLCDGCDKSRRFVKSLDGRTLLCLKCRVRYLIGKATGKFDE